MYYKKFQECSLSALGFGTMRLPVVDGQIDQKQVEEMTDYAIAHGVNYFDTAYPYHDGTSEISIGKALSKYPRESYFLADKYPGHQIWKDYTPSRFFEDQLQKCGVDYFDFYLIHNVCEQSIDTYMNPKWGILEYFVEQKRKGRIRHLGFSAHAELPLLKEFLDSPYGEHMEFCQIQLNYLDWDLQRARGKCKLLKERNLPIWVMEPVRGGRLVELAPASYAFRWLETVPEVTMILSGMSNLEQMKDNIATFDNMEKLSEEEVNGLYRKADALRDAVPCTGCRYCCPSCPMGLDIPSLIHSYNDMKLQNTFTPLMKVEALDPESRPGACLGCGKCAQMCPQHIDIPAIMDDFANKLASVPSWAEICRKREEAIEKLNSEK